MGSKIMGSKNACALEFAFILGRNIKFSVIIIIIIFLSKRNCHQNYKINVVGDIVLL